jgi:hypothetical protein
MNMQALDTSAVPSSGYKVDVSRGTRVGRVSSEWFSRPDDERFLSLDDLAQSVRGRADRSRTRVVETALIHVEASRAQPERLSLMLPGATSPVPPTHWSFGQFAAQVDGFVAEPVVPLSETERHADAETFIAHLGVQTVFGGAEAFYRPSTDLVHMPTFDRFRDAASFYGVWSHEHGHASGAKHRLDRDLSGRFGSASYAAEECCVEILSGLILADLGIAHHPRPDHAAYIASWLKVLKDDSRAIFTAASKARQAAD